MRPLACLRTETADSRLNTVKPPRPDHREAEAPKTGGFASLMVEDVAHAIEVARELESGHGRRVEFRHEPEHCVRPRPPRC